MVTVKSIIEKLQNYDPSARIEDLLLQPDFVRDVVKRYFTPPKKSRDTRSKQKNASEKALLAVQRVQRISLSTKILGKYKECQQCPSDFWSWAGIQLDLKTKLTKPPKVFFCEAYLGISRLEVQREWDTVNWRFFVLFFNDLVDCLGRKYISSTFEDQLVQTLTSSSIPDSPTDIRKNIKRWVACGVRYARLSKSLGNGAPFLLPQSVTDHTWESTLPLDGPLYEKAVAHLKTIRFCEISEKLGADILGTQIREAIMKPFRWSLTEFNNTCADDMHGRAARAATEQSSALSPHFNLPGGTTPIDLLYQAAVQAQEHEQMICKFSIRC
ncbi:hypothetical protein BKA64DRAFT_207246 [Cadophora sp. MPI-SDFR-AT-0126]|nr:hypothetical protein BKA64DRAFT_207246 [Leotiomycetes sp. MPI-SDFR-AT-0126]